MLDWGGDDTVSSVSAYDNPYAFTGQRFDEETALLYYRARYYDPEAGRFLSRDPIGFWGDPGALGNPYAYVGSDPLSLRDPTGMCGWWWCPPKEKTQEALCEGGSGFLLSFVPGVATGCEMARDYNSDATLFNEGLSLDYALAPLDFIPFGGFAKGSVRAGTKATQAAVRSADKIPDVVRHADEAADLAGASRAAPRLAEPVARTTLAVVRQVEDVVPFLVKDPDSLLGRVTHKVLEKAKRFLGDDTACLNCGRGVARSIDDLSAAQAANFKRFADKLPANAGPASIFDLPGGGKAFQSQVPGRVPGSYAIYEKQIDSAGRTLQYTKTTIDPYGNVVHVKDKIGGGVF